MLKKLRRVGLENHNFLLLHLTFASDYQPQKAGFAATRRSCALRAPAFCGDQGCQMHTSVAIHIQQGFQIRVFKHHSGDTVHIFFT